MRKIPRLERHSLPLKKGNGRAMLVVAPKAEVEKRDGTRIGASCALRQGGRGKFASGGLS
jgi:hypothetical protein